MNCDPKSLLTAARCFQCIPSRVIRSAIISQLCRWANQPRGCNDPVYLDWKARVEAGVGPGVVSDATNNAVCQFCLDLRLAGIIDKMHAVNVIIPDDFDAMLYPLIYRPGNGNSPWLNFNFVAADLSVGGLQGRGADGNTYMDTGFIPSVQWGAFGNDEGGLSVYKAQPKSGQSDINMEDIGVLVTPDRWFEMQTYSPSYLDFETSCWSGNAQVLGGFAGSETEAFFSCSRLLTTDFRAYYGSSMIPFAQLGLTNALDVSLQQLPNIPVFFMAINLDGVAVDFSYNRISFVAVHDGLTQAETQDLFNAVQTLRTSLGGGYV